MGIQKLTQFFHTMCLCFRLTHIKSNLWLHIFPVIYHSIVHIDRIPHNISQETNGILMKPFCWMNHHIPALFFVSPFTDRNDFPCGTICYFPPFPDIIPVIHLQHCRIQMIHQMYFQTIFRCRMERCHNIHLLNFVRIRFCPFIIFSGCTVSRIDLCSGILQFLRKFRTITVTECICSPLIHDLQCLRHHIQICRYGYTTFVLLHYLCPPFSFSIIVILFFSSVILPSLI